MQPYLQVWAAERHPVKASEAVVTHQQQLYFSEEQENPHSPSCLRTAFQGLGCISPYFCPVDLVVGQDQGTRVGGAKSVTRTCPVLGQLHHLPLLRPLPQAVGVLCYTRLPGAEAHQLQLGPSLLFQNSWE